MEHLKLQVSEEYEHERIDKYINIFIDSLSRNYIQKMLKNEQILVNGISVKPSYQVNADDEILCMIPDMQKLEIEAENIPLNVLFEDKDVIVVNKPKGMVVHPASGHSNGTLVNALMYHCGDDLSGINGILRPGIVHRIDKDTTGSIIACKNDYAHNCIAEQLKEHSIHRCYHAICHGVIQEEHGTVNGPIGRHKTERKKMAIDTKNGKEAITHYEVIQRFQNYTYVKCTLETGRTHQIRVHMASIGHPLLGDIIYGSKSKYTNLEGQTLHAMMLGFIHPSTKQYVEINAPLPEYFKKLLVILEK